MTRGITGEEDMGTAYKEIGRAVKLSDGLDKVTGSAKYVADIQFPGMLYVKTLRSPYAHAEIVSIDTSKAAELPGVVDILTYRDSPERQLAHGAGRSIHPHCVGDEVAVVAATDVYTALDAIELIDVEYRELPAVFSPEEAMKPGAVQVWPEGNIAGPKPGEPWVAAYGDVEQGFAEADRVFEDEFYVSPTQGATMEPRGCVAKWENGRLTVWSSTQLAQELHEDLARVFDLKMSQVTVMNQFVGGGFGHKMAERLMYIAPLLAMRTRRPVKYILSREEEFYQRRKYSMHMRIKLGVKNDGMMTAVKTRVVYDIGAYGSQAGGSTALEGFRWQAMSTYRWKNMHWEAWDVNTNNPTSATLRGVASTGQVLFLEQFLDAVAYNLGTDPIEFRLKNHTQSGDPLDGGTTTLSSCALSDCLTVGEERIGWKEDRRPSGTATGTKRRGIGVACHLYGTAYDRAVSSAVIKFHEDGTATLLIGTADLGQGARTIFPQIAGEVLGIPAEDIVTQNYDSNVVPFGAPTIASTHTLTTGPAVKAAAEDARQQLLARAAQRLGVRADDLTLGDRKAYLKSDPDTFITIAQISSEATTAPPHPPFHGEELPTGSIIGRGSNEHRTSPVDARQIAAHFAEVEVDVETGKITLLKLVLVHDSGTPINMGTITGQIEGAAGMGLSYGVFEELHIDEGGRILNPSLADFKLPSAEDMPDMEAVVVDSYEPLGAFGAKGIGEGAILSVGPAIANAVFNATGVRVVGRPLTPERVRKALRDAGVVPDSASQEVPVTSAPAVVARSAVEK